MPDEKSVAKSIVGKIVVFLVVAVLVVAVIIDSLDPGEPAEWVDCVIDNKTIQVHENVRMYMLNTRFLRDITIDREEPYKGFKLMSVTENEAGDFSVQLESADNGSVVELTLPLCELSE